MSEYQEINSFLQKPGSITTQSFILKGVATSSKGDSKLDLNGLLELLNMTNDINMQLKVFSALSAYLMFNKGANFDILIKSNAVYDKIQQVLSRGLPGKSTEALNFLSAMLYIDAEEGSTSKKRTLALYARNMTRVSGCLSAMCEMFTNCMMYHDTWKALCQCAAVACSGCETNQSYCSHLIPVCIKKCSQVNIDILLVLQSLMLNHIRNTQLFLGCNGVSIFTRELLHYDKCLQLLTTVAVQCLDTLRPLLQQTNVLKDLRDFLRLYGPNSQLGQKAIIILNHITAHISAKVKESNQKAIASEIKMQTNKYIIDTDATKKSVLEKDFNANTENEFEETKNLIENVMKEIFKWKQSELQNLKKADNKSVIDGVNRSRRPSIASKLKFACKKKPINCNETNTPTRKRTNDTNNMKNESRRHRLHYSIGSELSFSFLQNDDFKIAKNTDKTKSPFRFHKKYTKPLNIDDTQMNDTDFNETISGARKDDLPAITLQDFRPIFSSTPKSAEKASINYTEATVKTYKTSDEQAKQNRYKKLKMKRQKAKKEQQKEKVMKNRSLGARFFSAINDSCTTFVKSVKNIFNKKKSSNDSLSSSSNRTENTVVKDKRSETYSFINYMRKRDAVLSNNLMRNKSSDHSGFNTAPNSCKTCDNTDFLKQKLTKDEFLKQTVKKLKLGINLYGCDFKKISKTMWPREKYMTPLVINNLYRKLLIK